MLRTLTLTLAICFCSTIAVRGQETQLAPQHKELQELAGKWSFTLKAGEGPESKGECEYKSECGGLWLTSDFKTEFEGVKFQGKGFDGYDTAKKKHVSVWIDSMTSAPMFFEGGFDAKGEKLTMTSSAPGPDGKPGTWRSVTTINSPDKHVFEMFFKPQSGEEMQMMTIVYTRKGK
jgi:hypothetical protein